MSTREPSVHSSIDDEKKGNVHIAIVTEEADTGAQLVAGTTTEVDPAEALRVQRKIDRHIMPLMCSEYLLSTRLRHE